MSAEAESQEVLAVALLLFLRAGRPVPARLEVNGQVWPVSRAETVGSFMECFPAMMDKPCSRMPERVRAPYPMICSKEEHA